MAALNEEQTMIRDQATAWVTERSEEHTSELQSL